MEFLYPILEDLGIREQWQEAVPPLIAFGSVLVFFGGKLTYETKSKMAILLPFLPETILLWIDLIITTLFSIIISLVVFQPNDALSSLSAGMSWTMVLDMGGHASHRLKSISTVTPPSDKDGLG